MDYLEISNEIHSDLMSGVYNNYQILKQQMSDLHRKLLECYYVSNKTLSEREISLLIDNGYLEEEA